MEQYIVNTTILEVEKDKGILTKFSFLQNNPNLFNTLTKIKDTILVGTGDALFLQNIKF